MLFDSPYARNYSDYGLGNHDGSGDGLGADAYGDSDLLGLGWGDTFGVHFYFLPSLDLLLLVLVDLDT